MIVNFRYHIFTITAIFAALGLGILIGTSIIGDEALIQEQKRIIENIGGDIKNIKNENISLKEDMNSLKQELEYREEMEKEILSLFIKDKKDILQDKKYILYSESEEKAKEIKEIFKLADVNINVKNDSEFLQADSSISEKLILWDNNTDLYESIKNKDNLENEVLYCKEEDLIEFILTFMESEILDEE
ncbi:MAG: copper transporter [Bacillota bacterium]